MNIFLTTCFVLSITQVAQAQTAKYEYDKLQRLTKAIYDNGSAITYQYDANGNRISQVTSLAQGVNMDVTIETASLVSPTVAQGGTLIVNGSEKNIGTSGTVQHYVQFYLSTNNSWDAGDSKLEEILVGNLPASGSSAFVNRSVTVPVNVVPGNYFLLVAADGGNNLAETNESNNVVALTATVVLAGSVFTFVGSGNYNIAANWIGSQLPPNPLPTGYSIIINGTGEYILNIPQTISPGGKLTVNDNKKFKVQGNLIIK